MGGAGGRLPQTKCACYNQPILAVVSVCGVRRAVTQMLLKTYTYAGNGGVVGCWPFASRLVGNEKQVQNTMYTLLRVRVDFLISYAIGTFQTLARVRIFSAKTCVVLRVSFDISV